MFEIENLEIKNTHIIEDSVSRINLIFKHRKKSILIESQSLQNKFVGIKKFNITG